MMQKSGFGGGIDPSIKKKNVHLYRSMRPYAIAWMGLSATKVVNTACRNYSLRNTRHTHTRTPVDRFVFFFFVLCARRRHDNDAEKISDISVRPTAAEILCERRSYLPTNDLSKCAGMNHLKVCWFLMFLRFRSIALEFQDECNISLSPGVLAPSRA